MQFARATQSSKPQTERSSEGSDEHEAPEGDRKRRRRIARPLSVVAVALAAAALVVAGLVPGPPGAAGPGTIMAHTSRGGPVTIGASCTHYPGAEVTIEVPRVGTIVVTGTVGVGIGHETGIVDETRIAVAPSATECTLNNYTAFVSVPASLPSDAFHFETVPLLRAFDVAEAGSYTFYVNGIMFRGADPGDRFDSASLVAVFYPA